jgi:primosomal protein N' (replication factor Y)
LYFYKTAIISSKLPFLPIYQSDKKIDINSIITVSLRKKEKQALVVLEVEKPDFKCEDIILVTDLYFPNSYIKIIEFMAKYYISSIGEVLGLFAPFKKVDITFNKVSYKIKKELSNMQKEALKFINTHKSSLLFGDTSSGKTEVYIHLIKSHLDKNKSSILLMPEISLTPQIEIRLKDVFGELVYVWHSKLTKKQRNETIDKLERHSPVIVIGARSALFLPIRNLSLIIVDEEHDDSYKAVSSPYINAKDIALYMGKSLNIQVLLGSATPSLNSYYKINTFRLKGNFFEADNEIIFTKKGLTDSFYYIDEIKNTLNQNKQIMVFVPTRANFKYVRCLNCSETLKCENCSVAMSIYHNQNLVKCHYCGYIKRIEKLCKACGFDALSVDRMGTMEVVKFLSEHIDANIEIFDRDNITSNTKLKKVLKNFNDKKIDILVGTQMLSKGHNYHNIGLCIILDIDTVLNIADFRSREKALSLFLQVAGRSGRKDNGKVIASTKNADFFKMYIGKYNLFLEDEKKFRKNLYPPFVNLARLVFVDSNKQRALGELEDIIGTLKKINKSEIVGYGECAIFRIKNKYRYYILLRNSSIKQLLSTVHIFSEKKFLVDINPINFT